jgi:hypothetical protein
VSRLKQLHRDERERLSGLQKVADENGGCDMALNTNWMRCAFCIETFTGVDRKLIVQLSQIPRNAEKSLMLGVYDGLPMHSYKNDGFTISSLELPPKSPR